MNRGRQAITQGVNDIINAYASYEEKKQRQRTQQYLAETDFEITKWRKELSKHNTKEYANKRADGLSQNAIEQFDSMYENFLEDAPDDTTRNMLNRERDLMRNKIQYKFQVQEDNLNTNYGIRGLKSRRDQTLDYLFDNPDVSEGQNAYRKFDLELEENKDLLLDAKGIEAFRSAHGDFAKAVLDGHLSFGNNGLKVAKDFLTRENHPQKLLANTLSSSEKASYLRKIEALEKKEQNERDRSTLNSLTAYISGLSGGSISTGVPSQKKELMSSLARGYSSDEEGVIAKTDQLNAMMRLSEAEDQFLLKGDISDIEAGQGMPPLKTLSGEILLQNGLKEVREKALRNLTRKGADYLYAKDPGIREKTVNVMSGEEGAYSELKAGLDTFYDTHEIPPIYRQYLPKPIKHTYKTMFDKAKAQRDAKGYTAAIYALDRAFGEESYSMAKEIGNQDGMVLTMMEPSFAEKYAQHIVTDIKASSDEIRKERESVFVGSDLSQVLQNLGGSRNKAMAIKEMSIIEESQAKWNLVEKDADYIQKAFTSKYRPLISSHAKILVNKKSPYNDQIQDDIEYLFSLDNLSEKLGVAIPEGFTKEQIDKRIQNDYHFVSDFNYDTYLLVDRNTSHPLAKQGKDQLEPVTFTAQELATFVWKDKMSKIQKKSKEQIKKEEEFLKTVPPQTQKAIRKMRGY
jgi:hypothetical protein